jgi:hypothetical protein
MAIYCPLTPHQLPIGPKGPSMVWHRASRAIPSASFVQLCRGVGSFGAGRAVSTSNQDRSALQESHRVPLTLNRHVRGRGKHVASKIVNTGWLRGQTLDRVPDVLSTTGHQDPSVGERYGRVRRMSLWCEPPSQPIRTRHSSRMPAATRAGSVILNTLYIDRCQAHQFGSVKAPIVLPASISRQ